MGLLSRGIVLERDIILKHSTTLAGKLNTDIDRLYYMVRAAGKVRVSLVVKTLGIARKQVDDYANILADQGLIAIRRPLIGDVVFESLERQGKVPPLIMTGVLLWIVFS